MKETTTQSIRLGKKQYYTAFIRSLFFLAFFFGIQESFAQKSWDGGGDGTNWSSGNNWNPNGVPSSTDAVTIGSAFNVSLNTSTTVASLTVNGSLVIGSGNPNYALTVTGNVTIASGATISATGNGGNTLNIGGNLSNAGTITDSAGDMDIIFNGGTQTISGAGSFTFTDFLFSASGTKTINSSINVNGNWTNNGGTVGGTGTVTIGATGTIGGTASTAFPNLTITGGTVTQGINTTVSGDYSQTGGTFRQNSGATGYSLTVNGNFSLSGSSIFALQTNSSGLGATTTVNGSTGTTISGSASIIMDSGGAPVANISVFQTKNFTSTSTANSSTGIIDFGNRNNTKSNEFRVSGNFSKTGATGRFYTTATASNGGLVFNGSGATQTVSITASSNTEYYNVTVNSGALVQLTSALTLGAANNPASSMTVNGTLDTQSFSPGILGGNSGTFTLGSAATLRTGNTSGVVSATSGTISTSVANRNFNNAANYIFDGAANQTANFGNTTIGNLTIANTAGSVSLNAAITASGDITINSGASLTAGSSTHQVAGNWTNNGGTFVPGTGTVSLNGTAQAVGGTSSLLNFNNLSLSGGTKTFGKPLAVSGNLSIASGAVANLGSLTTHSAATLTLGSLGTAAGKFGSTSITAAAPVFKNNTYFTPSTTGYITVGTSGCTAPTITFTAVGTVCPGATSITVPYSAFTGAPDQYSISGTGITSVTNGALNAAPSSILIGLSTPATPGTINPGTFTVSSSVTGCVSANLGGSVTVTPNVGTPSFTAGATTVCQDAADTTYTATTSNSTAISYSVLPAGAGVINSSTGVMNWNASFNGSATITASAAGCNGPATADRIVTVTPTVGTPSFTAGATTICQDAANGTYTATATNATGITYSVSPAGAGTMNSATGSMDWSSSYSGTATITASAAGCGGPKTATRSVTVTPTVGTPTFSSGAVTVCQDASNTTYVASATNSTGLTYSVSPAEAGIIGSSNGIMNWDADFSGTAIITATAAGCNGPKTGTRSVTVTPTVGTPTFTAGATTVCQDAANTTYTATASDSTGMSYSISPSGAGSINSSTGVVNWNASFNGTATITASAAGCNGPVTGTRTVSVTPIVGTPVFTAGATSVCMDSPNEIYAASATNSTTITYSVSPSGAGTINSSTGEMDWSSTYTGTATITASAAGCSGPKTATRSVSVVTLGTPTFTSGSTTVCQDASNTTYAASATNSTGITYSVSPPEAGVIGSSNGVMNWDADFNGTAIITATAAGCNGPKTATRSVTVTPTVGTPVFTAGAITVCQDAANETYAAAATDSSFILYTVSPSGAGSMNLISGVMNWSASFSGTATITASASGCGSSSSNRVVTVTPTVGTPSFTAGATALCQDAVDETYTASATNASGIIYSVAPSGAGIMDPSTGIMDWAPGFSGTATITATATGCNGPKTVTRTVVITPTVGTPTFTAGATTLCQDAANETYAATATTTTGITYSIAPVGAGNIGITNGIVDWNASFSGTATITASAAGCNGPATVDRTVIITPTVSMPSFISGAITVCQDAPDTTYTATASNSTAITYGVSPTGAGTIDSLTGIMNWSPAFSGTATITATAAGCNGPLTADRIVTVNALPSVTASSVSGCAGSPIALSGSGMPGGGFGSYSVSNPYIGTNSTTYTYTYTDANGCSATSSAANIIITPQPLWYLDADGDQYYTGAAIPSCTSPGIGYTNAALLGGNDCDDNNININPGAVDICYNNIDENCNGTFSDGCAPVVVNMQASYNNSTLPSLSTATPAVGYSYGSETNIKYRFSVKNLTTGVTAPDVIQVSRYVTIPLAIHSYNSSYSIKASAVINEEILPFAGNTITVLSPTVQLVTLNNSICGSTLASLTTTLTANPGLNATGYTFRIRLNDANPAPVYAYSQSATRFVGANSFTGFPLQYSSSYKIAVQYTFIDPVTNLPVESGYGTECTVNTPSIPLVGMASPTCNSQVAAINATISASAASYATGYQFRIRLFSDNSNSIYYYTPVTASRFSTLPSFQGITWAYNTNYAISVQYSVLNGTSTVWSGYGPECKIRTPFFPVTSLLPNQCGSENPTPLTKQLNISPYPGFPHYKVKLEEVGGEEVVNSEEIEISYSHFKLSDFSIAQPGKMYNVSVAIKLNGVFGDYDTACDLFTADLSKTEIAASFEAKAYPNPFANNFMLNIVTSSKSTINVKVYDMVGRMIEQKEVRLSDMENTAIGNQYPSGVYNVVVSQDDSIETIRVVKR
ncbi:MAG: T9SS type A sorting domain-containing protein [Flavobacterium sp.]